MNGRLCGISPPCYEIRIKSAAEIGSFLHRGSVQERHKKADPLACVVTLPKCLTRRVTLTFHVEAAVRELPTMSRSPRKNAIADLDLGEGDAPPCASCGSPGATEASRETASTCGRKRVKPIKSNVANSFNGHDPNLPYLFRGLSTTRGGRGFGRGRVN